LKRLRPPTPSIGRTVTNIMMTPAPPSHCMKLRQNRMLLGQDSMLVMMLEPVVVKPLMVSNMASTTLIPYMTNGIAPITVSASQPVATTNIASVGRVFSGDR